MIGRRQPFNAHRGGPGSAKVIDVYAREGCHLCEEALAIVREVAAGSGARIVEHDVDADPELRERYGELVPVVLVNGEPHAQWRVDPDRLRQALRPGRGRPARGGLDGRPVPRGE